MKPIFIASLTVAFSLLGDGMLYAVLPAKAAALGIPIVLVGILLSVNRWIRIATNFGAASIFTRWGARRSMVTGSLLAISSTLCYGIFPFFAAMLPARLAWGTAFSLLRLGVYQTVLANSSEINRGRFMGLFQSITWLGSMVGALIGGILVESVGFRITAISFGVVGFLSLALSSKVGKDLDATVDSANGEVKLRDFRTLLRWSPEFRILFIILIGSFAGTGLVVPTLGYLLFTKYGDTVDAFGVVTGVAAVAGVFISARFATETLLAPPFGILSDIIGRRLTSILTGVAMVAGLSLLFLADSLLEIALGSLIVFSAASGLQVALTAWAGDLSTKNSWTVLMSGFATFRDIGTALGPLIALPAATIFGAQSIYAVAAIILLGALILLPKTPDRSRKADTAQTLRTS